MNTWANYMRTHLYIENLLNPQKYIMFYTSPDILDKEML